MASGNNARRDVRRFFIGIGVGSYDDPALNLARAEPDVAEVGEWFTKRSGVQHTRVLEKLGNSPSVSTITESLRDFLDGLTPDDVVVIYMACHGELEGSRAYLFGCNTPRQGLAGRSIEATTIGAILGQSAPHNVLLVVDACVAGQLSKTIQRSAEDASDDLNNRDPHRPHALVVVASTYGRDPAFDGRFAEAFLRIVSDERWTGSKSQWVDVEHLIEGLNEELKDIGSPQVAELRFSATGKAKLIPNPNFTLRQLTGIIADEEFDAHFDPAARGVAHGETGTFFSGRVNELRRIVKWFKDAEPIAADGEAHAQSSKLLIITGSPGTGKSALLARVAVLSDPVLRLDGETLANLAEGTVPPMSAFQGVIWCHNKTKRQIIEEIATVLGGSAATTDALVQLADGRTAIIAVDALDETEDGQAREVANQVLKPLVEQTGIRLLVATRRQPVRDAAGGKADLLDHLGANVASIIDLDEASDAHSDICTYAEARIRATAAKGSPVADAATDLADQIANAAGSSFLVAAIAARSAGMGKLTRAKDGTYILPTAVGEALAGFISALSDPVKMRELLRPLAWSQGVGMPWGTLWSRLATALSGLAEEAGTTYRDDDVRDMLDEAGDLVVESVDMGQPVYRLFHEALAEHLRAETDFIRSHDALARAMLDLAEERSHWRNVQRYVTANLPVHLLGAGRIDDLSKLLTDPTWDRCRREETGDPLAAVGIADAAIAGILADEPTDLRAAPICVAHSRAMASAAPLILDVLARSGQLARAEMMANNLVFAPDRMLAYRQLCAVYAGERDMGAARRCCEEVRRTLPSMPFTHRPMAWFWLTQAALKAGLAEVACDAAKSAVDTAFAIEGDGWDVPNGFFWAARACNLTDLKTGTLRIRDGLDALDGGMARRNQALQAASAAGHCGFLELRLSEYFEGGRFPGGMIRDGNIALALADAGMDLEATRVFDFVADGAPEGSPDSNKRWVWALALTKRHGKAIQSLSHIRDSIEKGKAIARIATIARARKDKKTLRALVPFVKPLLDEFEPRSMARLIRVLWFSGEQAEALTLAEQEITTGHANRPIADPRDGIGPEGAAVAMVLMGGAVKIGKRAMVSSVVPVSDEQLSRDAEFEAGKGNLLKAMEYLEKIAVPQFRAQALAAIAKHEKDPDRAVASWLRALADARRAGRGVIDEIWPLGSELLNRAGRSDDARALNRKIKEIDALWEMESFSEQYEALRKTVPSGVERTQRMTALLLVPQRLARTHEWNRDDIQVGWASDENGKRLFVLELIKADPRLASAQVLVDGIRMSRSAFEQYHALLAAARADLKGDEALAVRAAVEAEVRGDPRPDGVQPDIKQDSARMGAAQMVLNRKGG